MTLDRPVSLEGLGAIYAAPLAASDNLVEFHPDVDMGDARARYDPRTGS